MDSAAGVLKREIESVLIGNLVLSGDVNPSLAKQAFTSGLSEAHFNDPIYQRVFAAMRGLYEQGLSVEPTGIIRALQEDGMEGSNETGWKNLLEWGYEKDIRFGVQERGDPEVFIGSVDGFDLAGDWGK